MEKKLNRSVQSPKGIVEAKKSQGLIINIFVRIYAHLELNKYNLDCNVNNARHCVILQRYFDWCRCSRRKTVLKIFTKT